MKKTTTENAVASFLSATELLAALIVEDARYSMYVTTPGGCYDNAVAYNSFPAEARATVFAKHTVELAAVIAKRVAVEALHIEALSYNAMPSDIRNELFEAIKPVPKPVVKTGSISIDPKTASGKLLIAIQANPCTPEELLAMVVDRNNTPTENRLAALHKRMLAFKKDHGINVVLADGKYSVA